jgi:hypothetical protein
MDFPKRFKLISYYEEEWETAKKILIQLRKICINDKKSLDEKFQKLTSTIQIFESQHRFNQFNAEDIINLHTKKCIDLETAIKEHYKNNEILFYTKIIPFIVDQALLLPERAKKKYGEQTLPLMKSGKAMKEEIPKTLILSILANDFFCNHKDFVSQLNLKQKQLTHLEEWCNVDWYWLYSFDGNVSINRIICFLAYFDFAQTIFESKNNYFENNVTIERIIFNSKNIISDLSKCTLLFDESDINIHCQSMETPEIETQSIVDFANMDFQTGQIIPSATQEEILFSIRPEMFIAMFICQRIYENEIIIISGAYKLFEYEGYSHSFKFIKIDENIYKNYNNNLNENVLALDATMMDHYNYNSIVQDVSKYYTACNYCCKKYKMPGISTGSWGCGAFGCDKAHKFMQQLICAKANNVKLSFSTFGNENYCNSLRELLKTIIKKKPKVMDLWKLIINFKGNKNEAFHDYLKNELGNEFYI